MVWTQVQGLRQLPSAQHGGWTQSVLTKSRGNTGESSSKGGGRWDQRVIQVPLEEIQENDFHGVLIKRLQAISADKALPVGRWESELFQTDGT